MIETIPYQEILREALREGGEFADLFFEQTHSVVIICEEDRIEKVISGLDRGVGLRILFGQKTFYGFTTELSKESLLNLARRISRSAKEDGGGKTIGLTQAKRPALSSLPISKSPYPIQRHPEKLSMEERVSVVKRANDAARRFDPHVQQVKVLYRDVNQKISISNSAGLFVEGERVGTVFSVQVVSAKGDVVQTGYEPAGVLQGHRTQGRAAGICPVEGLQGDSFRPDLYSHIRPGRSPDPCCGDPRCRWQQRPRVQKATDVPR